MWCKTVFRTGFFFEKVLKKKIMWSCCIELITSISVVRIFLSPLQKNPGIFTKKSSKNREFLDIHVVARIGGSTPPDHQPYLIVEAEGWWNKSEVLEACQVGQALSKKFIINSVTYLGNSHNNVTPAVDNWSCIVGGLLCLLSSIYFMFLLCVNCNT